jgi:hypothetical protein
MEYKTEILDSSVLETSNNNVDPQELISLNKFIFLSIISFGLYEIWWTYKAWRFYKQKDGLDIMPAARALFGIFFTASLFREVLDHAEKEGYQETYSPGGLFAGFFIFNILSRLPKPFWIISVFSFICFIPPFKALNYARKNSKDIIIKEQNSFNTKQAILIIVGIIFWALVILGLIMTN